MSIIYIVYLHIEVKWRLQEAEIPSGRIKIVIRETE